jgi:hypothetical protein
LTIRSATEPLPGSTSSSSAIAVSKIASGVRSGSMSKSSRTSSVRVQA